MAHQLNINAHQVIVDLVNALEHYINSHDEFYVDWLAVEKALEQGKEFLGITEEKEPVITHNPQVKSEKQQFKDALQRLGKSIDDFIQSIENDKNKEGVDI